MVGWIIGGLAIAVVVAFFMSRAREYRRLFGDEHFIGIGRDIGKLKAAAAARPIENDGDVPRSQDDPRVLMTPAGLAIVYTVQKRDSKFLHHCSVSVPGGITAHAVGGTFVVFVMKLAGIPIERAVFEIGATTVHHGEAALDPADHEALVRLPTPEVSASNVAEFRNASLEARNSIDWKMPERP